MPEKYTIEDFLSISGASGASFSPDGERIAFLSGAGGVSQLYTAPRGGGVPRQLTFSGEPVEFAVFSPAKDSIIFGMGAGGNEKTQFYLYDIHTDKTTPLTENPRCIHRWGGWSHDGRFIAYSSNERSGPDFDVRIMEVETRKSRMVFRAGGWCDAMGFSPSGSMLVARKQHTFLRHELYLIDTLSGKSELITPPGADAVYGIPRWIPGESQCPGWMPDESGFFILSSEGRDFMGIMFCDIRGKKRGYVLTPGCDADSAALSPDGKHLAVILNRGGWGELKIYEPRGSAPDSACSFPEGRISGICWSGDGKHMAFNFESAVKHPEIYVWSREENTCPQITRSPRRVPEKICVSPVHEHYASFDGLEIPLLIFTPPGGKKRLPAVIDIHGGPTSQRRPVFDPMTQYLVRRGYAVIAPNIRGSTGYGKKYASLDDGKKRTGAIKDLASLHDYLKQKTEINPGKTALMGRSYGGYMTLAGLVFYPDLWAAGVDIVGFSNLATFLENTSSWRRPLREPEYGYLETDREFLESISPLNFIENIKAPLMIVHGRNDPRVPVSESEQIHRRLESRGVNTELLVYEDEGHRLKKLTNRIHAFSRIADFLDSCLKT